MTSSELVKKIGTWLSIQTSASAGDDPFRPHPADDEQTDQRARQREQQEERAADQPEHRRADVQLPHDRDGGQAEHQLVEEVQCLEQEQHDDDECGALAHYVVPVRR